VRASGGRAERTEGVIETIPDANGIVKGILTDDDTRIHVEVSSGGDPRTDPKAAWHLVAQVNICVDRCVGRIFYPYGRFQKTVVREKLVEAQQAVKVLDPFSKKLAVFILKSQVEADNLGYGYPRVKEIAVANHLIIIKAKPHIREKLRLILFADHVVRIAQANVRSIYPVLYQTCAQRDGKATVFRIAADHAANTPVNARETSRSRLVVDQVAASQQGDAGVFRIQIRPPEGLRAGAVCQTNPLRAVGNAKRQVLTIGKIITFDGSRID